MSTLPPGSAPLPQNAAAPPPEGAPALSEGERLMNVFIAPSKTFTDLKRKANWWVPWLVLAITSWIFVGIAGQKVGFRQISENRMRMSAKAQERMAQVPAEQRERMMEVQTMVTKVISFAFPLFLLVIFIIYAAILMATFNFGMGTEISFGTSLAAVVYAHLPTVIKSVLAIVALFAGADPEGFTFENPVASNLGYFVDVSAHPALHALATAADIFTIWVVVLTGIAFANVSKLKRSTAIGVVFGWYALATLFGTAVAAVFS